MFADRLLSCTARAKRLELATDDMHAWSAYLCGQANALGLPLIDTTLDVDQVSEALFPHLTG